MRTPPLDHSSPALPEDGVRKGWRVGRGAGGLADLRPQAREWRVGRGHRTPDPPHLLQRLIIPAGGVPHGRCSGDPSRCSCLSAARPPLVGAAGPAACPLPVEGALLPPPAAGLGGRGSGRRGLRVTRPGDRRHAHAGPGDRRPGTHRRDADMGNPFESSRSGHPAPCTPRGTGRATAARTHSSLLDSVSGPRIVAPLPAARTSGRVHPA